MTRPKVSSLVIVGILALACSRAVFFLVNDPEGPNLLVVVVLAAIIYAVFLAAHFVFSRE